MPKYNSKQLKAMARTVMADHDAGGHRSMNLFIVISMHTSLSANVVRDRIRFLAHD